MTRVPGIADHGPRARFSIVIATFNSAATLAAALDSVLSQGRDDVELLVIDGGSTDGTMDVVRTYHSDIAHAVSEPDAGIYDAWNKGLRAASGDYIGFIGADDIYLPRALAAYDACIADNPGCEYVSSRVRYGCPPDDRIIGKAWSWDTFRRWMTVAHVGSMHSRSLYERVGYYDDSFGITGDYELLLRAGPTLHACFTPAITAQMGTGGVSAGHDGKVFREAALAKALHSDLGARRIMLDNAVARAKAFVRSTFRGMK